ncbi:MAG: aminopeptidase [Gemmatimonadaceae bacterium]
MPSPAVRTRRTRWRGLPRLGCLGSIVLLVTFLLTPTGCYLSRAGWEEARILARRRDIGALVADTTATDAATRQKLAVVLAARRFARDSLGLRVKESFTQFSQLDRDTLVLVLSAAYRDRLRLHTWWFPIVGSVPYKGWFDFEEAKRQARDFEQRGYDVHLRPASAFSTLGFFNDPLLSTTLDLDSLELANTVIHEVTHNTYYAPGQAVFNESFANFVGSRGAAEFYRSRGDEGAAAEIDVRWEDEKLLGAFWTGLYHTLDSAFDARPGDGAAAKAARLAVRDSLYRDARTRLVRDLAPRLRTVSARALERVRIDNAALMARRIYLTELELFDEVWRREGRSTRRAVGRVIELAKAEPKDPYAALRRWLGPSP